MSARSLPPASSARFAATIAAGYLVFGVAWILFSDRVLLALIADPGLLSRVQSLKGVAFVVVTAAALFVILRRTAAGRTRSLLRRAGQVADLGGMLGESASGTFAATVCASLRRATGGGPVAFLVADESGEMLALDTAAGFPPEQVERIRPALFFRFGESRGIVGQVAARREPRYVPDALHDPDWLHADPALRSAYFTPVILGERVFGVLAMFATELDAFTPAQRALADLVASLTATGLAQARLAEAERRTDRAFRELVEHSPAGIFRIALDGTLLEANPAIAASTGYSGPRELLAATAKQPAALFADPATFDRLMSALKGQGHIPLFEAETRGRGERSRWMLITARTVMDPNGAPLYYEGTAIDITPRKQAEVDLAEARERIARQERLSALGEMASIVAHDFNNALTPVQGYAELLQDGAARDPERVAKFASLIRRGAEDAAGIVRRLREFARPGGAAPRATVGCRALLEETAEMGRFRWRSVVAGKPGTFEVRIEGREPSVHGDAAALRQAMLNLAFNAVDASPDGGTVRLTAREEGARVVIEVTDSGRGMTEDVRRRCLEPFFTTKGERGTGLGLGSVQRIVEEHGGSLDIRTAPGEGATFTLSFPRNGGSG